MSSLLILGYSVLSPLNSVFAQGSTPQIPDFRITKKLLLQYDKSSVDVSTLFYSYFFTRKMSSGLTPVVALFLELMLKNLIRKLFTVMVIGLFLIIIMVVMIMMSVMFVFIGPNPSSETDSSL